MAKSLGLRVPSGFNNPDSVDEAVLQPITPSSNLGALVAAILAASANAMHVLVDVEARRVYAAEAEGNSIIDAIDGATGVTNIGTLLQDEDARTVPFHRSGSAGYTLAPPAGVTALETLVAIPAKTSYSVAGLVSKIEDAITAKDAAVPSDVLGIGADNAMLLVDQAASNVVLYKVTDAQIAARRTALAAGAQIEYEQIPAAEASGAATLAFE